MLPPSKCLLTPLPALLGLTLLGVTLLGAMGCKDKSGDTGPELIVGITGSFADVAAGGAFTCAIDSEAAIICWGDDSDGAVSGAPTDTGWLEISAGTGHACARKADGVPSCWGDNEHGQATPNPTPILQISAGDDHSCSVQADGYMNCWGNSELGATVPPNNRFEFVSAGTGFTCGIAVDDTTMCWGRDDLETDSGITSDSPVNAASGSFAVVAAGDGFACGASSIGGVSCWGDTSGWPDLFESDAPYRQLSLSAAEACGVTDVGDAWCARLAESGGDLGTDDYVDVSTGGGHGCALTDSGNLSCWALDSASDAAVAGP